MSITAAEAAARAEDFLRESLPDADDHAFIDAELAVLALKLGEDEQAVRYLALLRDVAEYACVMHKQLRIAEAALADPALQAQDDERRRMPVLRAQMLRVEDEVEREFDLCRALARDLGDARCAAALATVRRLADRYSWGR